MTVGWGVIGLGEYADRHLMPAIMQSSNGKLVAVCHYRKEKAEFFASRNGAARSYVSLQEMVSDPDVDVVALCTPVNQHAEQGIQAAQAGKHVWAEIPMEATVAAAEALVEGCRKAGVKLGVGFEHRFHPAHLEMRRLISAGEIGKVAFAEARFSIPSEGGLIGGQTYWKIPPRPVVEYSLRKWTEDPKNRGGNAVAHLGFVLDTLRFLLGGEVKEVTALTDVMDDPQGREHKVAALLNFEGDIYTLAFGSHECPYDDNSITVYGTEGRLRGVGTLGLETKGELQVLKVRGSGLEKDVQRQAHRFDTLTGLYFEGERTLTTTQYPGANMYVAQVEAFNTCIEEDAEPPCSGIDGLRVRQIATAILQSSRGRRVVGLSEVEIGS